MSDKPLQGKWALILGASSGFGAAAGKALAAAGANICGVHLDLRSSLPAAKAVIADIEALGVKTLFVNTNAADTDKRTKVLDALAAELGPGGKVHVFMHSLAFGSLLPFIADNPDEAISQAQMEMTSNVMAHSLVYWTQDLVRRGMLGDGSRIFSMTSEGSTRCRAQIWRSLGRQSRVGSAYAPTGPGARFARGAGQLHPGRRHRYTGAAQNPRQ